MKFISWFISICFVILLSGCLQRNRPSSETSSDILPLKVKVHRYEKDLFTLDPSRLRSEVIRLMPAYPLFLGETPPDTASLMRLMDYLQDTLIQAIYKETDKKYPDLDTLESELGRAFANYGKAFPGFRPPVVYTYISGIDYENPVRLTDTSLIIALDMYLGPESRFYAQAGIPQFRTLQFTPAHIVPDVIKTMIFNQIPRDNNDKNLLEWMIFYGKMMLALDQIMPETPDYLKIAYLPEQLQWCRENEEKIWSFFIANKLLFTTDSKQIMNFIPDAPFTKGFSKESPGRLGWWVGWQIVRKFAEENQDISLPQLLQITGQEILNKSGYKPER
ncbi:MAG: hypothetical protein AB9842_00765 [Bacteroidales bacterium]